MISFLAVLLLASTDMIRMSSKSKESLMSQVFYPATDFTMAFQNNIPDVIITLANFTSKGLSLNIHEKVLDYQVAAKDFPFYVNSNGCFDMKLETLPNVKYSSYSYSHVCYEFNNDNIPLTAIRVNSATSIPQLFTLDYFPCISILSTYKKTLTSGERFGIVFAKKQL